MLNNTFVGMLFSFYFNVWSRKGLLLCGYLKNGQLLRNATITKKNAIFFTIFIFGNIRIRISATMDFCLHFSRSIAVDIYSCQDILYIQNVFRYCTRGFVHKSVYTCIINGPGVSKIEKGQWNISNFPLKFWSVFVKFEISHWHQSDSELEPLLFMTRLFRISGSSFICLISFCNDTVLLISISCSFFIFTWFFFRSSSSFVIVLTVFSSSILIEVSSVRIFIQQCYLVARRIFRRHFYWRSNPFTSLVCHTHRRWYICRWQSIQRTCYSEHRMK